jgi:hypothetical protein
MVIQCGAAALWRELVVANAEPRREKHVVKLCKALKTALRSFDRAGLGCPMRQALLINPPPGPRYRSA